MKKKYGTLNIEQLVSETDRFSVCPSISKSLENTTFIWEEIWEQQTIKIRFYAHEKEALYL